jgi:hypothetical protein
MNKAQVDEKGRCNYIKIGIESGDEKFWQK